MFLYQIVDEHIRILGCRGYDGTIRIPEKIGNRPVSELAAYAFSGGWGRDEMLASAGSSIRLCDEEGNPVAAEEKDMPPVISCGRLKDLYLPDTVKKIGNYAFYNCYELTHLECFSSISDMGSGLFTGCSGIRFLDIHIVDEKRSCMKEMLSELRQELYVNYYSSRGNARLVFPEMFEESVEHTPARIIIREMHGCGHMYRYCFDRTEFQFHKYDALFPHILVQEPERVVAALVLGRLFTPVSLLKQDRNIYESYLKEHMAGAAKLALGEPDPSLFLWLARQYGHNRDDFDGMVEMAGKADKPELLSILMELRRRRFPARKRTFSL
ncbi:leucine-rich repeat protein [Clostridium sp. Marseille-P2415]|uniref:leucine-rich repeat protein n=1 Tax=Clostridium sp. Marseille-P2415 TaxID=1805471 RepID=UPI00098873AC|nr:leucine-rich repeat protein [Clostridium sp. Marseille-P2415]